MFCFNSQMSTDWPKDTDVMIQFSIVIITLAFGHLYKINTCFHRNKDKWPVVNSLFTLICCIMFNNKKYFVTHQIHFTSSAIRTKYWTLKFILDPGKILTPGPLLAFSGAFHNQYMRMDTCLHDNWANSSRWGRLKFCLKLLSQHNWAQQHSYYIKVPLYLNLLSLQYH